MPKISIPIPKIKDIIFIFKPMILVQQTFGMPLAISTVGQVDILLHLVLAMANCVMQGSVASIGLPVLALRGGGATSASIRNSCTRAAPITAPTVSRLAPSQNNNSIHLIFYRQYDYKYVQGEYEIRIKT